MSMRRILCRVNFKGTAHNTYIIVLFSHDYNSSKNPASIIHPWRVVALLTRPSVCAKCVVQFHKNDRIVVKFSLGRRCFQLPTRNHHEDQ